MAPKLSWEMEQQLGYTVKADIARWPDQVIEWLMNVDKWHVIHLKKIRQKKKKEKKIV